MRRQLAWPTLLYLLVLFLLPMCSVLVYSIRERDYSGQVGRRSRRRGGGKRAVPTPFPSSGGRSPWRWG